MDEIISSKTLCLIISPPPHTFSSSIVHKSYELYLFIHLNINAFPKRDRYTLGIQIEQRALKILELIMLAREKEGPSKILILHKIDVELKLLKLFIRMSFDILALPEKKYIDVSEKIIEIGKMLGGWIKDTKGPV
ncbi:MAG: diversity-generating retroelement protein Avd [Patescibacteria group bacterium]